MFSRPLIIFVSFFCTLIPISLQVRYPKCYSGGYTIPTEALPEQRRLKYSFKVCYLCLSVMLLAFFTTIQNCWIICSVLSVASPRPFSAIWSVRAHLFGQSIISKCCNAHLCLLNSILSVSPIVQIILSSNLVL